MKPIGVIFSFAMLVGLPLPAMAADFDGSRRLICATVDARDCVRNEACFEKLDEVGAPKFLRLDFENKVIIGPEHTTPIVEMNRDDRQLLLGGKEQGYAWALALDQATGHFAATLTNIEGAFVLFGNCTPL